MVEKILSGIAILLAVIAIGVVMTNPTSSVKETPAGGVVEFQKKSFTEGAYFGTGREFEVDRSGTVTYLERTETVSAAKTLTAKESGKTIFISGTGAAYTLPAVTNTGAVYRFYVSAAFATNAVITSAEGDNIEGSIIVAGAVVTCDAADVITFVADGENIGDFVEVRSDGTNWLIGASGTLTASKMTCTG